MHNNTKMTTKLPLVLAVLAVLATGVLGASSFVRCNDAISCDNYNTDPKVGGIMRCKPRKTSSMHCTKSYCCSSTPVDNTEENTDSEETVEVVNVDPETTTKEYVEPTPTDETEITLTEEVAADVVPTPAASGSLIRCNTVVPCANYKVDGTKGGIQRCKNRAGSTMSCSTSYCCAAATAGDAISSLVRCNKAVTCAAYFADPADGNVLRCRKFPGYTTSCTQKFCCRSTVAADKVPTTTVRCDDVVPCTKFKSAADGGSRKCKNGLGYTGSKACTSSYCCASVVPQPDVITITPTATKDVTPTPASGSSFILCTDSISCNTYYSDPKTGGVLRCKPRASSTMACSTGYCCVN